MSIQPIKNKSREAHFRSEIIRCENFIKLKKNYFILFYIEISAILPKFQLKKKRNHRKNFESVCNESLSRAISQNFTRKKFQALMGNIK